MLEVECSATRQVNGQEPYKRSPRFVHLCLHPKSLRSQVKKFKSKHLRERTDAKDPAEEKDHKHHQNKDPKGLDHLQALWGDSKAVKGDLTNGRLCGSRLADGRSFFIVSFICSSGRCITRWRNRRRLGCSCRLSRHCSDLKSSRRKKIVCPTLL